MIEDGLEPDSRVVDFNLTPSPTSLAVHIVQAPAVMNVNITTRVNMGVPHLLSAAIHARQLVALETRHAGEPFGEFWHEILASASAVVFCSVAGIESYANELFADRAKLFPSIPEPALRMVWESFERASILDKFQLALTLRSVAPLSKGELPWQDAALLIDLRNALTHFKPEWSDEVAKHAQLSKRLESRLVAGVFLPGETLFPRAWASARTAIWALQAAVRLLQAFEARAGVDSRIAPFLSRLDVEP